MAETNMVLDIIKQIWFDRGRGEYLPIADAVALLTGIAQDKTSPECEKAHISLLALWAGFGFKLTHDRAAVMSFFEHVPGGDLWRLRMIAVYDRTVPRREFVDAVRLQALIDHGVVTDTDGYLRLSETAAWLQIDLINSMRGLSLHEPPPEPPPEEEGGPPPRVTH